MRTKRNLEVAFRYKFTTVTGWADGIFGKCPVCTVYKRRFTGLVQSIKLPVYGVLAVPTNDRWMGNDETPLVEETGVNCWWKAVLKVARYVNLIFIAVSELGVWFAAKNPFEYAVYCANWALRHCHQALKYYKISYSWVTVSKHIYIMQKLRLRMQAVI